MISSRNWWPWTKPGYITTTRRQSNNQWSDGIAAHPDQKYSECKNPLENFSPGFLGSRLYLPRWLSSKGTNYLRGGLLISAGAIGGHFKGKTQREVHQVWLVLARKRPGSPDICNPRDSGLTGIPLSRPPILFSGFGPVRLPPVPWIEKTIEGSHFLSDAEVNAVAETWLEGQIS